LTAFRALRLELRPNTEEWAVRCGLGWFPLQMTGYKNITFAPPGARYNIDPNKVWNESVDVVGNWVCPGVMTYPDSMALAHASIHDQIRSAARWWSAPSVGLTGGRDSRAIVAAMAAEKIEFTPRVRGLPGDFDVDVASQLAKQAGLELTVQQRKGLPAQTEDDLRRCLAGAVLWQRGYIEFNLHKLFTAGRPELAGGELTIMGQHGEIGRGNYTRAIGALKRGPKEYEGAFIEYILAEELSLVRPDWHDYVRDVVQTAYSQCQAYDLEGYETLDFFHLFEKTRRWGSGGRYANPGFVFPPFLNVDFIRATYGLPGKKRMRQPFHKYCLRVDMPQWHSIQFAKDLQALAKKGETQDGPGLGENGPRRWDRAIGWASYDADLYWEQVGHPVLVEALECGEFWKEIMDPDVVRANPAQAREHLVVLHYVEQAP